MNLLLLSFALSVFAAEDFTWGRMGSDMTATEEEKLLVKTRSSSHKGVYAKPAMSAGKHEIEIEVSKCPDGDAFYGICPESAVSRARENDLMHENHQCIFLYGWHGAMYKHRSGDTVVGSPAMPFYKTGDVVKMELDFAAQTLSYYKNGDLYGTRKVTTPGPWYWTLAIYRSGDSWRIKKAVPSGPAFGPDAAFATVDVDQNGFLRNDDVTKALETLHSWANEFNAHESGEVAFAKVTELANAYDAGQTKLMNDIIALDVDSSGTIGDSDLQVYIAKVAEEEHAMQEFQKKLIQARADLGGKAGSEIPISEIRNFFGNRKAERRTYLETLFRQMGGSDSKAVTVDDFKRFYQNMMVYMAVLNKVGDVGFELSQADFKKYIDDQSIVITKAARRLQQAEYDLDL